MDYKNKLSKLAQQAGTKTALLLLGSALLPTSCSSDKQYTEEELQAKIEERLEQGKEARAKSAKTAFIATMGEWRGYTPESLLLEINKAHGSASASALEGVILQEFVYEESDPSKGLLPTITGAFGKALEAATKKSSGGIFSSDAKRNSASIYWLCRSLELIKDLAPVVQAKEYKEEAFKELIAAYKKDLHEIKVEYNPDSDTNKPLEKKEATITPEDNLKEATKVIGEEFDQALKNYKETIGIESVDGEAAKDNKEGK